MFVGHHEVDITITLRYRVKVAGTPRRTTR